MGVRVRDGGVSGPVGGGLRAGVHACVCAAVERGAVLYDAGGEFAAESRVSVDL